MLNKKLPQMIYNRITIFGIFVAAIAAIAMTFLYVIDLYASSTNPYFGIFLYMIIPGFLIFGLLLIPVGMYLRWRKYKKDGVLDKEKWPKLDLNEPRQRNFTIIFAAGTILMLGATAIGSYEAFHFSESVTFCGKVCHEVMKPEYTAYKESPHSRVACVECHVGPGADWYAKSKLSGAYQVYAVTVDNYPRPIPTPVKNLRPARETCEQCHWPEKFFGSRQKNFDHYMYDESNRHWPIEMLVKVGGGNIRTGTVSDIHWHVSSNIEVEYIARDEQRQDIPWVRVVNRSTGDETIYRNEEDPLDEAMVDSLQRRTMDCVDCHNRPSHIYHSPDFAIDEAIAAGKIDSTLPSIKMVAVEAMSAEYDTEKEALEGIDQAITSYYSENYPELADSVSGEIITAVASVQSEFTRNIFPEMKVRWEAYPNNIGHFNWPGCNRCHMGNHVSEEGEKITHDCNACHLILSQGTGERRQISSTAQGLEFSHPEDIFEAWREMPCSDCHTGVQP